MKRIRMLLIAAALVTGGAALATAQPLDRDGRRGYGDHDRHSDRDRGFDRYRDRDDRRRYFDRDDRRSFRDRDDRRFVDRDDHRYFIGERRWFNGYYWNWDGQRWCRRDGRAVFYFSF
jgi:Ni/Co efflux regulator RcnB